MKTGDKDFDLTVIMMNNYRGRIDSDLPMWVWKSEKLGAHVYSYHCPLNTKLAPGTVAVRISYGGYCVDELHAA